MSTIRDTDLVRTNDYADETGEVRVLDPEGKRLPGARVPDLSDEALVTMYEAMRTARLFDERAVSWQRQGRLATYAPMSGQEAGQVASTLALADEDWVFPTYREHAVRLVAGFDLPLILRGLMGAELPCGTVNGPTVAPEAIPIATQLPHATGAAMAADHRGDDSVALAHFGDGATSEGDFHEALNFAGVFDAPAVFLCHNNQWAISVHTTADDPDVYRDDDEVDYWRDRDPNDRLETFLRDTGRLDDEAVAAIESRVEERVTAAIETAEAQSTRDAETMFEDVYDEVPDRLASQRDQLRRLRDRHGGALLRE
ncbi:pyruvate dehydrogenase (acetyl-transferring) E1 component subunit alpha [Halobacteriales archaeon QH_8_67_27]|nr:MAG: pyruvate dehydrogenase (acetyl-transferring) E1 component subunit alpha [Halobacteriales archaeon QH_8_67_27]